MKVGRIWVDAKTRSFGGDREAAFLQLAAFVLGKKLSLGQFGVVACPGLAERSGLNSSQNISIQGVVPDSHEIVALPVTVRNLGGTF